MELHLRKDDSLEVTKPKTDSYCTYINNFSCGAWLSKFRKIFTLKVEVKSLSEELTLWI